MGLSSLVNGAVGAFDNVLSVFGYGQTHPYPAEYAEKVSNSGVKENDRNWRKSRGYGFRVVREGLPTKAAPGGWGDFILQINPQDLSQDEVFAIEVTPTYSGVVVEHQGTTLKKISISGTTGLSPKRREGGAHGATGAPVFNAGRSGYYEFQELRTYLRSYVEQKRVDTSQSLGELRLVWMNFKDHEYLYVEPTGFSLKRSSSRPHLYDYVINLTAIGVIGDELFQMDMLQQLDEAYETVLDTMNSAVSLINGSVGFALRANREINAMVLGPVKALANGIVALKKGKKRLATLKAPTAKDLKKAFDDIMNTYDTANYLLGKDLTFYNSVKGKVNTVPIEAQSKSLSISVDQMKCLNGLKKAIMGINKIGVIIAQLDKDQPEKADNPAKKTSQAIDSGYSGAKQASDKSSKELLTSQAQNDLDAAKTIGDKNQIADAQTALDDLAVTDETSDSKVKLMSDKESKYVKMEGNQTLQTFAANYFPDNPDAWREIAIRNGLVPPYVDPTPISVLNPKIPGVLRPGEQVLIPQDGTALPFSRGYLPTKGDWPISRNLGTLERSMGVDLKLTDDFDLDIDQANGDLDLIASIENLAQAIIVRIYMQKGSLITHPQIGTSLNIGEKTKATSLDLAVSEIRTSLTNDSRIDSVVYVDAKLESGTITIDMVLKIAGQDLPITIPLDLAA